MMHSKNFPALAGLVFSLCTVAAQPLRAADDHGAHGKPAASAPSGDLTDGEVRRVDRETGKVTLKHGEIKSLDMPPMTMVFVIRDKALLDGLKTGDKVRFKAVNEASQYIVTELQVVR